MPEHLAGGVPPIRNLAMVAHDHTKALLCSWVKTHADRLVGCRIFATGTTAVRLSETVPGLDIVALKSGPMGGDQQVGAMIAERRLDMVFFFQDPMTPQPHDADVRALVRLAVLYEMPTACNRATADFLISSPLFDEPEKAPPIEAAEERYADYLQRELPCTVGT